MSRFCSAVPIVLLLPLLLLADESAKPLQRIGFGSCLHQDREQPIWKPLLATRPELFLFIGDNIYADTADMKELRATYDRLLAQDGYKKLRATCPVLATWDDHDYGFNDSGAEFPARKEAQQIFLDFLGVPKTSPRRQREGIYHAEVFGPPGQRVQVILLDTRYHRSALKTDPKRPRHLGQYVPNTDPDATILGEAQWKWLEEQLRQPVEVRLLCSSIQVVSEDHGFEKWMNFPAERARLYKLLRDTEANGVVILSGDRHLAELSVADRVLSYPLYDLTSSGMNMANKRYRPLEPNRQRVALMDVGNNFGLIRIDWSKADPLLTLEIHDEDGDVTIRHKLPLSRLQPGKARKTTNNDEEKTPNLNALAREQVGKQWQVDFVVRSAGPAKPTTRVFLNSEKDFRSDRNLTVVLDLKALQADLKKAGITDVKKHFLNHKIRVTGQVTLFRDNPQIEVSKLDQIKVLE